MNYISIIPVLVVAVVGTGVAFAYNDGRCDVPISNWQPRNVVLEFAESNGWTVRRIKTEDGCYAIVGTDAGGNQIEVYIDPATLAIVELEYESWQYDDHESNRDAEPDD
jgi:hypothetical protein|tara:strand:+ start:2527 stop:2853 length:327 start_codon:yes stop_codon:yes gene_type:complete